MGWVESFFSALKAEVESLVTVVVGSGGEAAVSDDGQQADNADTSHNGSDSAPDAHTAIPSLMDQQADSGTADRSGTQHATGDSVLSPSSDAQTVDVATGLPPNLLPNADSLIDTAGHQQIAQDSDTQKAGGDPQTADTATHSPLLLNPDFLIDTTDHSATAPSESATSGPSGITAIADAPANQDFQLTLSGNDIHSGISSALLDAGEFALASVASQFYSFAQGAGGGGGGGSGGATGFNYHTGVGTTTSTDVYGGNTSPFQLELIFDSSWAKAPSWFVPDMENLANFFVNHFTNQASDPQGGFKMAVGWGELGGKALPSGAVGESTYSLYGVSYSTLQSYFNSVTVAGETANGSQVVNLPADTLGGSNHQFMLTGAQVHALHVPIGVSAGSVGFSSTANFSGSPTAGAVDFMGIAAHEMSEVLGRVSLNGVTSGHGPNAVTEYTPLDLFRGAGGTFSADGVQQFNTGSGDPGDWATTTDAFSANPSTGPLPFSYSDYLAMEASGWSGNYTGTASDWNALIAPTI